jgi:hypothetical protein
MPLQERPQQQQPEAQQRYHQQPLYSPRPERIEEEVFIDDDSIEDDAIQDLGRASLSHSLGDPPGTAAVDLEDFRLPLLPPDAVSAVHQEKDRVEPILEGAALASGSSRQFFPENMIPEEEVIRA